MNDVLLSFGLLLELHVPECLYSVYEGTVGYLSVTIEIDRILLL